MPRFPHTQPFLSTISGRPFSKFANEIANMGSARFPLHIGDTYLLPFSSARIEEIRCSDYPNAHKYVDPKGLPSLVHAISQSYNQPPENIQITAGATGGLHVVAMSLLSAGDEVLVLAPFWPLVVGIIRAVGAIPICVPFYDKEGSVSQRLSSFVTEKTVAVYMNSPNNPTGLLLEPEEVLALASFARRHDLWIFSDEVYERLLFTGTQLPMRLEAPERTISSYSFSKAYGMAGYRCGYIITPNEEIRSEINKAVVHSFYSVPTAAQHVAQIVLEDGDSWLQQTRLAYEDTGRMCADILGVPPPAGGTFLFFDIAPYLSGRTMDDILLACIREKLLLAPGASFGTGYESYVRLCFTSAEPSIVLEGMHILKSILHG